MFELIYLILFPDINICDIVYFLFFLNRL